MTTRSALLGTASTLACLAAVAGPARGDMVTLTTSVDNTLIEDPAGGYSEGAGYNFYAGRVGSNGGGTLRRGVIKFDCSAIPPGSNIQLVTLKLYCSKAGSTAAYTVTLKRLAASFGEGASFAFGGAGANSEPGDATWLHRFYPNVLWTTPGGDFSSTVSASKSVSTANAWYSWSSTPTLVADVQSWVNAPTANFGWIVQGNETTLQSVKRFDTKEAGVATRPQLVIVYTPPVFGDLTSDSKVNASDLAVLLGQWGGPGSADLNTSGLVDGADLALMLGAWTG